MGNALLQQLGFAQLANRIPDPGSGGTIRPLGEQSLSVCVVSPAGSETRYLEDGAVAGQMILLINNTGNEVTVTDKASSANTVATLTGLESTLAVFTGLDADPWHAVQLKQSAT